MQPAENPPSLDKPRANYVNVTGYEGSPRRLLIVDDEAENRRILRDLLQPLGFEIEEAMDGTQCLERCAYRLPDAVLLDLRMGKLDGFEVARTLRRSFAGNPLGILAVSASVFESDRQQAIDAGCDDFLPKPFKEDQLLAILGRVLRLEWHVAENPVPSGGVEGPAEPNATPSPEEIDALLELSRRGDILGIKKRLGALQVAGAQNGAAFARRMAPLVASYQMDRIREVLVACKENSEA